MWSESVSIEMADKHQVKKMNTLFNIRTVTAEKFDQKQVDILCSVYDKSQGFVTPFHAELWSESWTGPSITWKAFLCQEGFSVPWDISTGGGGPTKNLHLAVLVVDGPECSRNRRCRGVGVLSLDDVKKSLSEAGGEDEEIALPTLNIAVETSRKEPTNTALGQLQNIFENQKMGSRVNSSGKILSLTFSARKLQSSDLKEGLPLLEPIQIPTLLSPKENKIGVTLDKGKISIHDMFGNSYGVSLEVSLLSSDGKEETCVWTNLGKTTATLARPQSPVLSLVSPNHDCCEWKESLCIDLGTERMVEEWRDFHIRISVYTHNPARESKLFGFAFLPLFDTRGILRDTNHKLFVFKTSHLDPDPAEYLAKEWVFDQNMPQMLLKKQNGPKFKVSKDSFLELQTRLSSTEVTEDIDIQALKSIDPMLSDDQVNDTFTSFINNGNKANCQAKRILFFQDLLDSLWRVLERLPKQEDNVFNSFIETIKPIVTRPNEFGYAEAFLDDYIRTRFKSRLVFDAFLRSFSSCLVAGEASVGRMYTLMSMKFIFKITVQSLKFTDDKNNIKPLETFMSTLQEFILKRGQSREVHNQQNRALRSLCEKETIAALIQVLPSVKLVDILEKVLSEKDEREDMGCITMTAIIDLLRSELFTDLNSQKRICQFALKIIQSQFKKSNCRESFRGEFSDAENLFKKKTLELIQELLSACRQRDGQPGAEERKTFLKLLRESVIVDLATLILSQENSTEGQTLEEKTFFSLMNDFDEGLLNNLVQKGNIYFFDDVFLISQRMKTFSVEDELQKTESTRCLAAVLSLVGEKGILEVTGRNLGVLENFLQAISALVLISNCNDLVKQLANTMKTALLGLPRETIHELLSRESQGSKGPVMMESICSVNLQMLGSAFENQDAPCMPDLLFEIFLAEFFAKIRKRCNSSFPLTHTWFMGHVDADEDKADNMFNTLCRNRWIPGLLKSFEKFSKTWRTRPDFQGNLFIYEDKVKSFKEKFQGWVKHVERLLSVSEDVELALEAERDSERKQIFYFGRVTALHNKYRTLLQLKKEALEEKLLLENDTDEVATYRDQCILVLKQIYEIQEKSDERHFQGLKDGDSNCISSAFTLHELSRIIPWSDKTAPAKIQIWVNVILSKGGSLQNIRKRWGDMKEALSSLAIKMFKDATGFECSIKMIKESIQRCEFELFDFEELANLHRNLAEIYEYRQDFQKKLEQEKDKTREDMKMRFLLRQHIINPEYYKITFRNPPKWLKFLANKSYIYRGDAMLQTPQMWKMLENWFPGVLIKNLQENSDTTGSEMVIFCGKVFMKILVILVHNAIPSFAGGCNDD